MKAVLDSASRLGLQDLKILTLVAGGLTDAEIGRELFLTDSAVSKALADRILPRFGARNRAHAVALAFEQGTLLLDAPLKRTRRRRWAEVQGVDLAVQAGMVGEP